MIQLVALRSFISKENGEKITYDKILRVSEEINSLDFLYRNIDKILAEIPEKDRWNIFYTIANCGEEKRQFESLQAIAFDIDGVDSMQWEKYLDALCHVTKTTPEVWNAVASGNGLHFIVSLASAQTKNFFKEEKTHYNAVCANLNKELAQIPLPGKADTTIFEPRRILRLPGTINRKVDKPDKECALLKLAAEPCDFLPSRISGVPKVSENEQVSKKLMRMYPKTDNEAILSQCGFLKHCKETPASLSEPQWYAALSITARMDGDENKTSHDISRGHPGYSPEDTSSKISQALSASGPRTCEAISNLWSGCASCPQFGKVESPIRLIGEDYIATELTGFHAPDKKGKLRPVLTDLIKYFNKKHPAVNLDDSRRVYVWKGTHYKEMGTASVDAFANNHFFPDPSKNLIKEFSFKMGINSIKPVEWWEESVRRKINFLNGYLDIDTMEFKPHDSSIAFRSVLPYDYDPSAKSDMFDKMLRLVTSNDREMIAVLEEYMGYCISNDDCWAQKALILPGTGSNGKSTFLEALKDMAGEKNISFVNMGQLKEPYQLALLDGALFNISEETDKSDLKYTSMFKTLVAGGEISVRMPYKEPYNIKNRAKLIITCNALPEVTDNSHGFHRRLIIVPFTQKIEVTSPDYDPFMKETLKKELPGIFNKAIEGYHRLRAQKRFSTSAKIEESLNEYKMDNDTVLYWAKEHLIVHTNGGFDLHATPLRDLYAHYRDLTKSMGSWPVKELAFYKEIARIQDIWGEHPYRERLERKNLVVNGQNAKLRIVKGVELPPVN
jgi:putative DNA primase/helicase